MNANDVLELRLGEHLAAEAPPRAPDWVLADALSKIDGTPQRRALVRVPWRTPTMPLSMKLAVAVGLLVAAAGIGLVAFGGAFGPAPTPIPTPTRFTSPLYDYAIDVPAGWQVRAGTETWPPSAVIERDDAPYLDVFTGDAAYGPLLVTSQVLSLPDNFWRAQQAAYPDFWGAGVGCPDPPESTGIEFSAPTSPLRPVAYLDVGCPSFGLRAVVTTVDRGYVFMVRGDAPEAWFRELLGTVVLAH